LGVIRYRLGEPAYLSATALDRQPSPFALRRCSPAYLVPHLARRADRNPPDLLFGRGVDNDDLFDFSHGPPETICFAVFLPYAVATDPQILLWLAPYCQPGIL
jgi:hypothetical protein